MGMMFQVLVLSMSDVKMSMEGDAGAGTALSMLQHLVYEACSGDVAALVTVCVP